VRTCPGRWRAGCPGGTLAAVGGLAEGGRLEVGGLRGVRSSSQAVVVSGGGGGGQSRSLRAGSPVGAGTTAWLDDRPDCRMRCARSGRVGRAPPCASDDQTRRRGTVVPGTKSPRYAALGGSAESGHQQCAPAAQQVHPATSRPAEPAEPDPHQQTGEPFIRPILTLRFIGLADGCRPRARLTARTGLIPLSRRMTSSS
jgi:hypothetical protein